MSNFLKNVIKETGNEYGTIVSDGLATADVSVAMSILGVLFLMLFVPVAFMVGYLKIKLLQSPESQQQEKHSSC